MISIRNLFFKYAGSAGYALDDVSLEIPDFKHTVIVGHNGSGKSTVAKIIAGLYKPTGGRVIVDGIEYSAETLKEVRKRIGLVFQNPDNQFIGSTVEDDIAFGLENKQVPQKEMWPIIERVTKSVGMFDHLNTAPQNLSGGQKQKVALASTLALDPKILIFDEITSMLDPKSKESVLQIVNDLRRDGKHTIVSITHDMNFAALADFMVVFSKGKIIATGHPIHVLADKVVVKEANIDVPFVYHLAEELNIRGKKVPLTFSLQELVETLCK